LRIGVGMCEQAVGCFSSFCIAFPHHRCALLIMCANSVTTLTLTIHIVFNFLYVKYITALLQKTA
jgi:hypothetical protein